MSNSAQQIQNSILECLDQAILTVDQSNNPHMEEDIHPMDDPQGEIADKIVQLMRKTGIDKDMLLEHLGEGPEEVIDYKFINTDTSPTSEDILKVFSVNFKDRKLYDELQLLFANIQPTYKDLVDGMDENLYSVNFKDDLMDETELDKRILSFVNDNSEVIDEILDFCEKNDCSYFRFIKMY